MDAVSQLSSNPNGDEGLKIEESHDAESSYDNEANAEHDTENGGGGDEVYDDTDPNGGDASALGSTVGGGGGGFGGAQTQSLMNLQYQQQQSLDSLYAQYSSQSSQHDYQSDPHASGPQSQKRHADDVNNFAQKKRFKPSGGAKVDLRILLPSKDAGAIIGRGGSNIKKLRAEHKTIIQVPDCDGPERLLLIGGETEMSISTLLDIIPLLEENQKFNSTEFATEMRLLVHQSQAGCIIGRSGDKIKELRLKHNLDMKVYSECAPMSTERVCQMRGKPNDIVSCLREVLVLLETAPPKGMSRPYDPHNFNEFLASQYGGYMNDKRQPGGPGDRTPSGDRHGGPSDQRGGGGGRESFRGDRHGGPGDRSQSRFGGGDRGGFYQDRRGGGMGGDRGGRGGFSERGGRGGGFGDRGGSFGDRGGSFGDRGGGFGDRGGDRGGRGGGFVDRGGRGGFQRGRGMGRDGGRGGGGRGGYSGFGGGGGAGYGGGGSGGGGSGGYGQQQQQGYQQGQQQQQSQGGYGAAPQSYSSAPPTQYHTAGGGASGGASLAPQTTSTATAALTTGVTAAAQPSSANMATNQVTIPNELAGAIIGPKGTKIQQIREQTGANITIDKPIPGTNDRIITIVGSAEQIQNAQYLLQMTVKQSGLWQNQ